MKNIPELPGCGHMGADFLRIYTSHGHSMKTKNCQPCHLELSAKLDVIERMPNKYAVYALAVSSACDSIQLGAKTTLKVLNALADISNSGDFAAGWPVYCEVNFHEIAVAAALTLPMNDELVKRAKQAHRPTLPIPPAPRISTEAKELIEETLDQARWAITQGKRWAPLVQLMHRGGVENMRIRGFGGTEEEKRIIARQIEEERLRLNASLVVMVSDAWVGASGDRVRPSKSPNRTEALTVAVWGADKVSTLGSLAYTRSLDGTVIFAEFEWGEPSSNCNIFAE
jgi:hypothetical protein